MTQKWPMVKLGEVLTERRETPVLDDIVAGRVRIIEKIGFNDGRIVLRANGTTKTGMILVRPGDLVVSGINAAKGAIAIYDAEATEPVAATIHYGSYIQNPERADARFLWWLLRSRYFRDLLSEHLPGGIKTELKANRLLRVPIPLPPLEEQRRIVARIEALAAQIEEARRLRREAAEEAEGIVDVYKDRIFGHPKMERWGVTLGVADVQINRATRNPKNDSPEEPFVYVDISSVGRGPSTLTSGRVLLGRDAPSRARRAIHADDIILSTVRPNLRAFAKVGPELDNEICSTGFAVITCGRSIDPDFLLHQCCSTFFVRQCLKKTTGGHYPAVNDKNLRNVVIVVPPMFEQRRIVAELDALQAEVDRLKGLQAETAAELDALQPSILDRAFKGEL